MHNTSSHLGGGDNNNNHHPLLPKGTATDGHGRVLYNAEMQLPRADDERGIVVFLGLDEHMAGEIRAAGRRSPVPADASRSEFPVVDRIVALYTSRESGSGGGAWNNAQPGAGDPRTQGALDQGLRPEFAAGCGQVEVNSIFASSLNFPPGRRAFFGAIFTDDSVGREDANRIVRRNAALLKDLWRQKIAVEGSL